MLIWRRMAAAKGEYPPLIPLATVIMSGVTCQWLMRRTVRAQPVLPEGQGTGCGESSLFSVESSLPANTQLPSHTECYRLLQEYSFDIPPGLWYTFRPSGGPFWTTATGGIAPFSDA